MTKTATKTEAKAHKSSHSSLSKAAPMLAEKEVFIKQEPVSDEDSIGGTPGSLSALIASAKGSVASSAPAPGSRAFAILQAASKGEKVVSPMKMMKAFVQKTNAKAAVKLMSFNIFGDEEMDEKDYTIALAMGGDFFALREQIKSVNKKETEVNGVCIPMVESALNPRFLSQAFLNTLMKAAPEGTKTCTKLIKDNFECMWFLYAPKVDEEAEERAGGASAAAISAAVGLDEYALIWRNALQGKPVHFDTVEHIQYYIGVEELELLQQMHTTADPHFGKRSSSIRK